MSDQPPANGTVSWRVSRLEQELHETRAEMDRRFDAVEGTLRRLLFATLAGTMTLAVAALVFALTIASGVNGGP